MANNMNKVAFFIGTLLAGGAERVVSELLRGLPDNIEKYLVLREKRIDYEYNGNLIILGTAVSDSIFRSLINIITNWRKLREIKHMEGITHTISFMEGANIANILSRKSDKVIISVRTFLSSS